MKKILLGLTLLFTLQFAHAQLFSGDILIVQYNADNTDNFAFAAMVDIPANEVINFTDNGWRAAGSFRANEGITIWTAPAGGVPCGTIVTITGTNASIGTATGSALAFSGSGDQLLAYQGTTASPTFLAGLQMNGNWDADANSSNTSAIPPGGALLAIDPETDNAAYDGSVFDDSRINIQLAVLNSANWTTSNSTNQFYGGGNFIVAECQALPVELVSFEAKATSKRSVMLEWATASEENNDYFVIEHSLNGIDFEELDYVVGAGTTLEPQAYNYLHERAGKGTHYYRLMQMDYDGAFSYSSVEVVELQANSGLTVSPTLARQHIEVSVGEEAAQQGGLLEVYDLNGRRLISAPIVDDNRQQINVSQLPNGQYLIRLSSERISEVARFVKIN